MTTVHRRSLTVGFSVTAILLVLASTAMACTILKGILVVTPLAAGSGVSQATGTGGNMSRCDISNGAVIPITGDRVKVEVKPATGCATNKLAAGTYTVNYASDGAYDCMTVVLGGVGTAPLGVGTPLGTFTVDGNGSGSTTLTVPGLSSSPTTIGLCVTSTTAQPAQGNQVQLTVI